MIVYGVNPVAEALRAGRLRELRVSDRSGPRVQPLVEEASRRGIRVRVVSADELTRQARGGVHQGVVGDVHERPALGIEDLLRRGEGGEAPLLVVLDGVEDPQNVGAVLRSVDAAGATGVIRQTRHAAPLDGAAAKASAGAVHHVPVADVVNIARAVEQLKDAGVWTVGLDADAKVAYDAVDLTLPTAVVLGAEGTGLRRLVRERCDTLVSIPMRGQVDSLNVSAAAAVVLFEAVRQRRSRGRP